MCCFSHLSLGFLGCQTPLAAKCFVTCDSFWIWVSKESAPGPKMAGLVQGSQPPYEATGSAPPPQTPKAAQKTGGGGQVEKEQSRAP